VLQKIVFDRIITNYTVKLNTYVIIVFNNYFLASGGFFSMFRVLNKMNTMRKLAFLLSVLIILTFPFGNRLQVRANTEIDISKPVKLKWIVIGNGDQKDIDIVHELINDYLKDKINATLELKTYMWGDDFEEHLSVFMSAGVPFDINFTSYWTVNYRENALKSYYKDITDLLDTYAPETKKLLGNNILRGAEVNGRIYALPVYNSSIIEDYGILLNEELVKKYNVDISKIKQLKDLEPILKTIKSRDKKVIGFYPYDEYGQNNVVNILNYDRLIDYNPGAVLRDGKSTEVVNEYETSEAKDLFSLLNKWYKAGYIPKISAPDIYFFDKSIGNTFAMYSSLSVFTSDSVRISTGYDFIPIRLGKAALTTSSVTSAMHAISANSKYPERALMLLDLVNTDEYLSNLINFGIEGYHYEKIGDNQINILDDGLEYYNPATSWLFGNQLITYLPSGINSNVWEGYEEYVNNAVPSPLLGFEVNINPIKIQLAKIYEIERKYLNGLVIGKDDPTSTLSKMNSEMNRAGLKTVIAEMQKQVDKFIKQKK